MELLVAAAEAGDRLINCARVIEDQICYDIKDANMLFELCHTRYSLHKLIYSHKTGIFRTVDPHLSPSHHFFKLERSNTCLLMRFSSQNP